MISRSLALAILSALLPTLYAAPPPGKPNILVIVADDLGWADVGYHGSKIKTPTIDRLCRSGVELDQHYVAPMCTPTRAGFLTGRYWSRYGNTKPSNERVLPWDTVTLAKALRTAGYDTAITGKWHLGSKTEWGPRKFGFNHSYGSLGGGVNPWNHRYKRGPYTETWHRDDVLIDETGHVTDLIAAEAVRFVETKRDTPFFLYVPFTAVHTPFDESQAWLDSAAHIPEARRQYAACAQHLDDAIGRIVDALQRHDFLKNTLIVFFSDNGGTHGDDSASYPDTEVKGSIQGLNTPLRGWKTQVYEGGIRVPAFVHWQDHLAPRKVTAPVHVVDWMPTLCKVAGYEAQDGLKWDGHDIGALLATDVRQPESRTLYFQGVGRRSAALRDGDWKLVVHRGETASKRELFDLAADPLERTDVSARHSERVKTLETLLTREEAEDQCLFELESKP